jgi:hypothetical protein
MATRGKPACKLELAVTISQADNASEQKPVDLSAESTII